LRAGKTLPAAVEDHHAPVAAHRADLSPRAEVEPNGCRFGGVGNDHPGAPGGGAAVPAEVGVDVNKF